MSKKIKSEVVRLTKEESNLITLIRKVGVDQTLQEIEKLSLLAEPSSLDFLKSFRVALKNDTPLTLEELVSQGDLTPEVAQILLEAYKQDKNIAITGAEGVGKTRLLKALINSVEDSKRVCVLESKNEIDPKRLYPDKHISTLPSNNLAVKDLMTTALRSDIQRIIIADITDLDDILTLLTTLTYKIPVVFTMTAEGVKDSLLGGVQTLKNAVSEVIENSDLLNVTCYKDGDQYKVKI